MSEGSFMIPLGRVSVGPVLQVYQQDFTRTDTIRISRGGRVLFDMGRRWRLELNELSHHVNADTKSRNDGFYLVRDLETYDGTFSVDLVRHKIVQRNMPRADSDIVGMVSWHFVLK